MDGLDFLLKAGRVLLEKIRKVLFSFCWF